MQIIESSVLGVRSARLTFAGGSDQPTVTLFPMIHVGEPDFFEAIYQDASRHDVVLVEGVKSPITTRITRAYRWMIGSPGLNLSLQPGYRSRASERVVLADLSHDEFVLAWRRVPLWLRLLIYVAGPVMALRMRGQITRAGLARGLGLDDAASSDELLHWTPETGMLDQAILDARDRRLIECLSTEVADPSVRSVAVIYGAAHMRAVIRDLSEHKRFRISASDWRPIFYL